MDKDKNLKLCVDCKHCRPRRLSSAGLEQCRKKIAYRSLVDGYISYENCVIIRSRENMCGIEGKWWEKKPPDYEKYSLYVIALMFLLWVQWQIWAN